MRQRTAPKELEWEDVCGSVCGTTRMGTEPIDYYEHWHAERSGNAPVLDRERAHLALLSTILQSDDALLDAGCGNGRFLRMIRKSFPRVRLVGADFSPVEVAAAAESGFQVAQANFESELPFADGEFAVVNLAQVIEHLRDPDRLLEEINRILRPGGHLVLSTPNLCAWFNRVLVPFGVQPIFYESSTRSARAGAGALRRFRASDHPVGHVRLFTLRALDDLLSLYGFSVDAVRGSIFDEGLPRPALAIDRVFAHRPQLASIIVIAARKHAFQPFTPAGSP
jgi:SAM-dependent methyltransferase